MRFLLSPALRISLGLVLLTISLLMAADLFGLAPDRTGAILESRKKTCEALAIQFSQLAQEGNLRVIRRTLEALVERNPDIVSAGLRNARGDLLAEAGDHQATWPKDLPAGRSTPRYAQVPLFSGEKPWGTVEVQFTDLQPDTWLGIPFPPFAQLVAFVALTGFGAFLVFMRRTLRHLDPTALVPARVKLALDALAEGVVLMDDQGRVVLANTAFQATTGLDEEQLLGNRIAEWEWHRADDGRLAEDLPWLRALRDGRPQTGIGLQLRLADGSEHRFMVNASPIPGPDGRMRGVLATFDDVTELEKKNAELEKALEELRRSRNEIRLQNQRLRVLATQDPLTGALNRRAFFEKFHGDLLKARRSKARISVIMADIDHFKRINDTFGHDMGDEVIRFIASLFQDALRSSDALCRYGGEEFCILLWDTDGEGALEKAEQLRGAVESQTRFEFPVTCSFGVTSMYWETESAEALIKQADEALYEAKRGGRNRVVAWHPPRHTAAGA